MVADKLKFAFAFAPVGDGDLSDEQLYAEVLADCRVGHALGYGSAWMLEHHFSDYFPTPSSLMFMSNLASQCPGLGFGAAVEPLSDPAVVHRRVPEWLPGARRGLRPGVH